MKNRALDAIQCGQIFFKFAFKSKLFSENWCILSFCQIKGISALSSQGLKRCSPKCPHPFIILKLYGLHQFVCRKQAYMNFREYLTFNSKPEKFGFYMIEILTFDNLLTQFCFKFEKECSSIKNSLAPLCEGCFADKMHLIGLMHGCIVL